MKKNAQYFDRISKFYIFVIDMSYVSKTVMEPSLRPGLLFPAKAELFRFGPLPALTKVHISYIID